MKNNILENPIFKFFKEISNIPRGSGNEKGMQEYLVNFAKERNLPFYKDKYNNVIIYKKTNNDKPIILQAHTDMVCVKDVKSKTDFQVDPIIFKQKGNLLQAKGTSLGADDGIGVAIILDILDSDIPVNIEAVFTSEEETTMCGAYNIDIKELKSKEMICLDGFEGNTIITSSASFTDFLIKFNNEKLLVDSANLSTYKLIISGLEGGHSGFDIDKNRGSSHKLTAELLSKIPNTYINSFVGGHNYNVIPSKTETVFSTATSEKDVKNIVKQVYLSAKRQYKNVKINCIKQLRNSIVLKNGEKFLNFILSFNQGVFFKDDDNYIVASQNLSEINSEQAFIKIGLRSSDKSKDAEMLKNLKVLCKKFDFDGKVIDTQPAFNTFKNSKMLEQLIKTGDNPKIVKMHIAVECGIFQDRVKGLDVAIISPTITNAHSTQETLDINSTIQTSNWLKKFLSNRK
ncbi:MAG: M20/M25/M40 family metallo-hydrolase [Clostridia bacterium]|nr:M20/M25/M40 family metallo-hydrolase [Clostridia bacterium]